MGQRFEAASTIEANCIAHSIPGTPFADILEMQKKLYKELGYAEEWRNHFQGGITGYTVNDSAMCFVPGASLQDKQAFNWFTTITGVNTEDIYINGKEQGEIITCRGAWPTRQYRAAGKEITLPEILLK
jgi:antitoxin VapB